MEHKYILLKDSDEYENLWRIINETNVAYIINRCEDISVVLKDTCFSKGGAILYSNAVRDFEPVSYEESDESYLRYLGIENYLPDYEKCKYDKELEYSYIDFDDNGDIYEILSLDYLKELEYNICGEKLVNGEDEL